MLRTLHLTLLFLLSIGWSFSQGSYRLQGIADPANGHFRQTPDGGYLLSGSYGQGGQFAGMMVVKMAADYSVEWSKVLQSDNGHLDYGIDAIPTPDGGYAVLGATDVEPWKNPVLAKMDYCLIKLDAQGAIQWAKRYGGHRTDLPYELSLTDNGGFLISGYASRGTDVLGNPKPYLVKVDSQGEMEWSFLQQNFTFNITLALLAHPSFQMKGIPTQDGGYFYAISSGEQGFFVKLDANGQVLWQKSTPMGGSWMGGEADQLWGVAASGGFLADVEELPGGEIAVLGNSFFFVAIGLDGQSDYIYVPVAFVLKMDAQGNPLAATAFFHPSGQPNNATDLYATDFSALPNGDYLITGSLAGNKAFLLQLDPTVDAIDQAKVWAEKFGTMNASSYPYDYDFPRLGVTHDGNYVSFFDNMRLHLTDRANPTGGNCTQSITVNSFPFSPTFSTPTITPDSLGQAINVNFTASDLQGVEDTTLCGLYALATEEAVLEPQWGLYPNPTQDALNIDLPENWKGKAVQAQIMDMTGRKVWQEAQVFAPAQLHLSTGNWPEGTYVLRLLHGQQQLSRTFLKR